ncbi:hypothetical protein G7Y89_g11039 [Cudoniella acicularis]|uniref:Heterokaryon incompatibility domain-containing protein n=1 Tax=Cudoniella acicularis TaxID=354080 RepID=A0A8H4RF83_9HELO|nr:hypothetical protein G7Y89_g11039 [Cudoniella acicularis]
MGAGEGNIVPEIHEIGVLLVYIKLSTRFACDKATPSHPFLSPSGSYQLKMPEPYENERIEKHNHPFREYAYQPLLLGDVRLLSIGTGSEELHITHASLNTAPSYTSVSYSWNGQQRDHDLHVDGQNLKVIKNLRNGLPHLIKQANTRFLWIDEICIDQKNDEEKALQIRLMREIYTKCQECLVWLGDRTLEADIAMDAIPRISQHLKLHDAVQVWEREGIAVGSPEVLDSSLWKGFVNLFSRPWFRRVWTFQECVLPDDVFFLSGSKVLAFADIEPLAMPLLHHLTSLQLFFHNAHLGEPGLHAGFLRVLRTAEFKSLNQKPKNCLDTLRLLYFTRPWIASNHLDKIYGILGLADSSLQDHLVVDYHSTDVQISRQVAQWYTSFGEDLFILNLASSFRRYEDGLPSWTPNFSRLGSHWCIGVIWPRFRTGMNKESVPRPFPSVLSGELHVRGFRVDQVTHVVSYSGKPNTNRAEKCRNILDWEETCLALSKSVFGETGIGVPDDHLEPNQGDYDSLKCFLKVNSTGQCLPPELEARNQDLAVQIRRLSQVSRLGKFFCTQNGRIGLGPISTRPQDQICIFYNGSTPFIIRQRPELGLKYQLVGDSYTYSLMNGEAFQSEIRQPDETFILI